MQIREHYIECPGMIMLGSTGRNVGKTEFACRLIQKYAQKIQVIGVKITNIRDTNGGCPRGSDGCGTCASLKVPFTITKETCRTSLKDTSRMLRAGADKVLWLKVKAEYLDIGILALLDQIPANAMIVCESNAARSAIKPGLFLMFTKSGSSPVKESARNMLPLANRRIVFLGDRWNIEPEHCRFSGNQWHFPLAASAVILAGGKSRRMGQDKSLLPVEGIPLIDYIARQLKPWFDDLMISTNTPEKHSFLSLPCIADSTPDGGPLAGISAALEKAKHPWLFVSGCDSPVIDTNLLTNLFELTTDKDIVMPVNTDGRHEPLFAFYHKSLRSDARAILASGKRRIIELLPTCRAVHPIINVSNLNNLNTPGDYARFLSMNKPQRCIKFYKNDETN